MIKKYTKKPVTVEAIIWDGANEIEIMKFIGAHCCVTTQHTINGTVTNLIISESDLQRRNCRCKLRKSQV